MTALLVAVVIAGVTGSLHCAAMCGPFAGVSGHLPAYGAGRLVAYATLGAIAGALGAAVDLAGDLATVGRIAMPLAGAALIAWGGLALARALGWRRGGGAAAGATGPMLHAIRRRRDARRAATIGALTALLPCGWLWAFVVVAGGTGAPHAGAAVMAALWLGSMPALIGAGAALRALGRRLGPRVPVITASLQIAIGVVALAIRVPALDATPPATPPGAAPTTVPTEASCH